MPQPGYEAPDMPFELPVMTPGPAQGATLKYDEGGVLPLGYVHVRNPTGRPIEPVILDPRSVDTITDHAGRIVGYRYHPQRGESDNPPDYDG